MIEGNMVIIEENKEYLERVRERQKKKQNLRDLVAYVNQESNTVEEIIGDILGEYAKPMDDFIRTIGYLIRDIEQGTITRFSQLRLEVLCMKLPILIYNANDFVETLAGKTGVARAYKRELFAKYRNEITFGTIPDKNAEAELKVINEELVEKIFDTAYRKLKSKVNKAEKLLDALKKILTSRIVTMEVFRKDAKTADLIDPDDYCDSTEPEEVF